MHDPTPGSLRAATDGPVRLARSPLASGLLVVGVLAASGPAAAQEPNFGRALALTDSELFVGQPVNWYGPGVVYVYRPEPSGRWIEDAVLTAPDSARMDDFGRALAIDGNTLVVGAPRKRDGAGVAYVFDREGRGEPWRTRQVLEAPSGGDPREYGAALALAGDDLFVGAPGVGATGAVHHFSRDDGQWRLAHVLVPPTDPDVTGFGSTLSWNGSELLVGAPAADEGRGRAFTVRPGPAGGWEPVRSVELPTGDLSARAGVGSAVLLGSERAFVGAPGEGVVFVLERQADASWSLVGALSPDDGEARSGFGASLAAAADDLWVGAPGADRNAGRAYRFTADGRGGWAPGSRLDPADGASWPMRYGYALAATPSVAAVGRPSSDFGEGSVSVLTPSGDGWASAQTLEGTIFRIGATLESGARCDDGAMAEFPCTNMELVAHVPLEDLAGERGAWVNDVWGWTDPETGRDYALVARRDGASFVDVTDPATPRVVGNLPRTDGSRPSVWRDIKVIGTTAYIVADGAGAHGMQVFDLTRLRSVGAEPVDFAPDATYRDIASAHNVVADAESGFLYIVGANSGGETCGGGLHMVDARDALRPTFAGCYNDAASPGSRGYTHDAQCLVYRGPDEDYRGRQICIGSNESEINIADVTDKSNPTTISRMSYPDVTYAHQGWFDGEQRYFYMNDEGDEVAGVVAGTRTIVWDLEDLDDPLVANQYIGPVRATDHNLFVVGNRMYQSNYGSGLRVIDISDRENPREIAFFDSAPYNENDPGTSASQSGAWSNYPFFSNGLVIFTSVREGLFIMRVLPPIT